jgi:uncharacterized protein (TIGR00299 family) protein
LRVAYFDASSGVAGDMMLAALVDVGVPLESVQRALARLELPISLQAERVLRGGFVATRVKVHAPDQASHRHLAQIEQLIERADLPAPAHDLALRIFRRLAQAEAHVHGKPIEQVHFHEVGALDSIVDIVGSAIALRALDVAECWAGPVAVGSGMVKCEHGLMPVPTPATAELLRGVPLASSSVPVELTTPTGAAILTTIVNRWLVGPAMTIERIGLGAGTRDLPTQPNVLRVFVGTAPEPAAAAEPGAAAAVAQSASSSLAWANDPATSDWVWVLETNLDDCPAEQLAFCVEELFAAGALDVFTVGVQMKKGRPGVLLTALCPEALLAQCEAIIFAQTATFGIRRRLCQRSKLAREMVTVPTPFGPVRGKVGRRPGLPSLFAPEYEDCARLARAAGVSLRTVYHAAIAAWTTPQPGEGDR